MSEGSSPRWRGRLGSPKSHQSPGWAHPRAGGDDVRSPALRFACGLIPALAGTTRSSAIPGRSTRAHPRAGGGRRRHRVGVGEGARLIPALAGTTPAFGRPGAQRRGSSPRWRGRQPIRSRGLRLHRLFPALAGTTGPWSRRDGWSGAHSRAGGDDRARLALAAGREGSSPRWRGRLIEFILGEADIGLIPALAGTTIPGGTLAERIAGGSSPRWRGRPEGGGAGTTRRRPGSCHVRRGLIPALAGTTALRAIPPSENGAHPRAGGDDHGCPRHDVVRARLIPALAGTTWRGASAACGMRAHIPALAGTTASSGSSGTSRQAWGSSPRWRGRLPVEGQHHRERGGLIPALAGTPLELVSPIVSSRWAHPAALAGTTAMRGCVVGRLRAREPRAGGDDHRVLQAAVVGDAGGSSPALAGTTSRPCVGVRAPHAWALCIPALAGTTK